MGVDVTYPKVYQNDDGTYTAEMHDRKTDKVWGIGRGEDRISAIFNARQQMPSNSFIKQSIGWIKRHPIMATVMVATYLLFRRQINSIIGNVTRIGKEVMVHFGVFKGIQALLGNGNNGFNGNRR